MSKEYFNSRATTWDEKVAEKDVSKLEMMLSHLDIRPGDSVLDVGTGTGIFVPYLLSKMGHDAELACLDFAEEMLEQAKAKVFNGNIRFICADIENSGLPDESFDVVVCYSVFPHFQNKPKALREICRILNKEGRLYICHTSSRHTINEIHRSLPEVCDHLFPENEDLHKMMLEAGFTDIIINDSEDYYLVSARKFS